MLTPYKAHQLLLESGKVGMDDPTDPNALWFYDKDKVLCHTRGRDYLCRHPAYRKGEPYVLPEVPEQKAEQQ